ncbi:alpha-amylase family glycosyl hydrolase [Phenylobacterium sp.]|uniref:alpha-amylase family glycosyl hydrolase n=1 Tax=Phenylobacterium sp. TaxID=1871053 RepID=UPI002F4020A9
MVEAPDDDFVWWKHGVIYQVYLRSFQDTDGDGIGDLEGVIRRLDALVALGVDAIWLSPFYASPMKDFGYDVRDHVSVDPVFGDLEVFERLVRAAHRRSLKVIVDFIPNHTSDQHLWFRESRSDLSNPRRDWYVWRDPAPGGGPPNNWRSEFGGPAWTFDPGRGQYYYHAFLRDQPDLNWREPRVAQAMEHVLRFWLDRGVDGFRVDAIHHLFEDAALRDNPPNPDWREGMPEAERWLRIHTIDQSEVHGPVAEMRRFVDSYEDGRILIGEAYLPLDRLMAYYGPAQDGFHLPFNFHLMSTPWTPRAIADLVSAYETRLPAHGWPNWVLGNHDRSRLASRLGPTQARVAAMLLLTLRGTPTLYQGDELGLTDVPIAPDQVRDPWELNLPGQGHGRDPARTPLPWTAGPGGGFTTGTPWLPLGPVGPETHAEAQAADQTSVLAFYRRLLAFRRSSSALTRGDYRPGEVTARTLSYDRCWRDERLRIVLNLSAEPETVAADGDLVLSTGRLIPRRMGRISVRGGEGVILRLAGP